MPGIVEKLQPPAARAPLTRQTVWWKEALPLLGDRARCIYTGAPLDPDDLSLDHYLPWSFVAHDRPWNLVPVSPRVNSAKSDSLPDRRWSKWPRARASRRGGCGDSACLIRSQSLEQCGSLRDALEDRLGDPFGESLRQG